MTTDKSAKRLRMYDAQGKKLKTWKSSEFAKASGPRRVWTLKYTFPSAGVWKLSFKASVDGKTFGKARSAELKVVAPPPAVTKVKAGAGKVKAGEVEHGFISGRLREAEAHVRHERSGNGSTMADRRGCCAGRPCIDERSMAGL